MKVSLVCKTRFVRIKGRKEKAFIATSINKRGDEEAVWEKEKKEKEIWDEEHRWRRRNHECESEAGFLLISCLFRFVPPDDDCAVLISVVLSLLVLFLGIRWNFQSYKCSQYNKESRQIHRLQERNWEEAKNWLKKFFVKIRWQTRFSFTQKSLQSSRFSSSYTMSMMATSISLSFLLPPRKWKECFSFSSPHPSFFFWSLFRVLVILSDLHD